MDENMQNYLSHMYDMVSDLRDQSLYENRRNQSYKNPLNNYGRKGFSQTDEDGITQEIIRRIGIDKGTFVEYGVGNGLENNTILLAGLGWSGIWIDSGKVPLNLKKVDKPKFEILQRFINMNNVLTTYTEGMERIGKKEADLISFDFESNDYYLVEKLLQSGVLPKVFIVEYNAKFIPPIEWKVEYKEGLTWQYDDYFGASLMSFVKLFQKYGYFLACCNGFTGSNAYFICNDYKKFFIDVPSKVEDIWVEPRYYTPNKYGHIRTSPQTVEVLLNSLNDSKD